MRILTMLAAAAVLAPSTRLPGQDVQPQWTPFETASQSAIPIVEARLNGSEGYRLVLDPSVGEVLLDIFLVEGTGMKLLSEGETAVIDYYRAGEEVPVVYLETLSVAGVEKRVVRTLIIKGDDVTLLTGVPSYGRIGREFLEPFRLTVYYPRKLLLLEPSPENEVPPGGAAFEWEERALLVSAKVNDNLEGRFIIDPAASVSMIDERWARRNGLTEEGATMVELSSLQVGELVHRKVPARVGDMGKIPGGDRAVGLVGATLLLQTAVTYDFPRSLIWLRPIEQEMEMGK